MARYRYTFSHLPLGRNFRNYADVGVSVDGDTGDVRVQAKLIPVSTDMFKDDDTWREDYPQVSEDDDDEHGYIPI